VQVTIIKSVSREYC